MLCQIACEPAECRLDPFSAHVIERLCQDAEGVIHSIVVEAPAFLPLGFRIAARPLVTLPTVCYNAFARLTARGRSHRSHQRGKIHGVR